MKREVIICDSCGDQTFDIYKSEGWFCLETGAGTTSIRQHRGRDAKGNAKTKTQTLVQSSRDRHFCCKSCLNEYFRELVDRIESFKD